MPTNSNRSKAESGSSLALETVRWNKGPRVAVHVFMEGGKVLSSKLCLSDSFTCAGANAAVLQWLEDYAGKRATSLFLAAGTPFQQKVLHRLSEIPFGKTLSYQELAALCGTPKGARAVGRACGKNPFPLFVPCHRVIQSNGTLGGFAFDVEIKRRLLEFEVI